MCKPSPVRKIARDLRAPMARLALLALLGSVEALDCNDQAGQKAVRLGMGLIVG